MAQEIGGRLSENSFAQSPGILDADTVSSLSLAYIGDSFYELTVRTEGLRRHNGNVNALNKFAKLYARATTQALMAELLKEEMSEKELAVYKRGRNAKGVSAPHTCSVSEYRRATGLETLCGWLYVEGLGERAGELILRGIELYERKTEEN